MSHHLVLCSLLRGFISSRSPGGTPERQHPCQPLFCVPMAPSLALGSHEVPGEGSDALNILPTSVMLFKSNVLKNMQGCVNATLAHKQKVLELLITRNGKR